MFNVPTGPIRADKGEALSKSDGDHSLDVVWTEQVPHHGHIKQIDYEAGKDLCTYRRFWHRVTVGCNGR